MRSGVGALLVGALTAVALTAVVPAASASPAPPAAPARADSPASGPSAPIAGLPPAGARPTGTPPAGASAADRTPAKAASTVAAAPATLPGTFVAVPPARVLDTRTGNGAPRARLAPGGTLTVAVAGRGGVPATGAGVVVLTLTATSVTSSGSVTVYPSGQSRPAIPNLRLTSGRVVSNLATVGLGSDGAVVVQSGATAPLDVVADVSGYYLAGRAIAPGTLTLLKPVRLADTTTGGGTTRAPLVAGEARDIAIGGRGGVTASAARSVVLNVTAVAPVAAGYLTVYPTGVARPTTVSVSFAAGQTVAGQVTVPLGPDGHVVVFLGGGTRSDVTVDVQAFVRTGAVLAPGAFRASAPSRVLDTRQDSTPEYGYASVPAGGDVSLYAVTGVPQHAVVAASLTVTVTQTHAAGSVTAYATGTARPSTVNLSFQNGTTVSGAVAVAVGAHGMVSLHNGSPSTVELVVDVAGYWFDGSLGAVTGVVTGPSGQPLAHAQVFVGDWDESGDQGGLEQAIFEPSAVTDAAGRYTADAIDTYTDATLCVSTTNATPVVGDTGLASTCGTRGAIRIKAGATRTANLVLTAIGVAVHGHLFGANGAPLAGVAVHVGQQWSSTTQSEPVTTAADGSYRILGLSPDGWIDALCFGAVPPGATSAVGYPAQCPYISGSGGADQTNDVTADEGTLVTGHVLDTAGHPLAHAGVTWGASDPNGNGTLLMTDSTGAYRLLVDPGGAASSLVVCVQARAYYSTPIVPSGGSSTTGYQDQCWKNLPMAYGTSGKYTSIPIAPGATVTGIDAALAPAAAISGQVRKPGGAGMGGVNVVLYGGDDVPFANPRTLTGADGRYRLGALRPGHYTVCFIPTIGAPIPPPTGLIGQCWHQTTPYDSEEVALTAGTEVTGIDADLNAGGTLTGRVTDSTGAPLDKAHVSIDGQQETTTGPDGVYRFDYVSPLPTRIFVQADEASGGSSSTGYLDTCVGCDTDPLHRSPVPVTAGATTTFDVALPSAAGIRVTVTDAQGNALRGARAAVFMVGSNSGVGTDATDADGQVVVGQLAPGTYTVCVVDATGATGGTSTGGYLQACYSPAPRSFTVRVTVSPAALAEATVQARPGAGVSGRLTDSAGRPVHGARVQVYGWTQPQDNAVVSTGADGTYSALGLTAGTYAVCYSGGAVDGVTEQFAPTCWKNKPNDGSATNYTPVKLKAGLLTGGVDQVLPTQ